MDTIKFFTLVSILGQEVTQFVKNLYKESPLWMRRKVPKIFNRMRVSYVYEKLGNAICYPSFHSYAKLDFTDFKTFIVFKVVFRDNVKDNMLHGQGPR